MKGSDFCPYCDPSDAERQAIGFLKEHGLPKIGSFIDKVKKAYAAEAIGGGKGSGSWMVFQKGRPDVSMFPEPGGRRIEVPELDVEDIHLTVEKK